jgi:hypothetical protein
MTEKQTPQQVQAHFRGLAQTYRQEAARASRTSGRQADQAKHTQTAETLDWAAAYISRFMEGGEQA